MMIDKLFLETLIAATKLNQVNWSFNDSYCYLELQDMSIKLSWPTEKLYVQYSGNDLNDSNESVPMSKRMRTKLLSAVRDYENWSKAQIVKKNLLDLQKLGKPPVDEVHFVIPGHESNDVMIEENMDSEILDMDEGPMFPPPSRSRALNRSSRGGIKLPF